MNPRALLCVLGAVWSTAPALRAGTTVPLYGLSKFESIWGIERPVSENVTTFWIDVRTKFVAARVLGGDRGVEQMVILPGLGC